MNSTDLRQRLADYHSFLYLAWAVSNDHSSASNEFHTALSSVSEFLSTASSRDIHDRGKTIETRLRKLVEAHEGAMPRKIDVGEIAHDFRLLVNTEPDVWRHGISHGWLQDRFDLSQLPQAKDLPRHARIGIGIHAGRVSVEEGSLLDDMFFLLVRARKSFENLQSFAHTQTTEPDSLPDRRRYKVISALNSSVCTYSRLGVLTSAAFVEAFVNSVGWNEAASRQDISESEKNVLLGKDTRNKGYLSLEKKLEGMPRIIGRESPIVISDKKQMKEPFISFLRETKQVRDASMHYAPGKTPILLPPDEWLQLVESSVKHAVSAAREFWAACYPGRQQPEYLAVLYYEGLQQYALDRLAAAEDVAIAPPDSLYS